MPYVICNKSKECGDEKCGHRKPHMANWDCEMPCMIKYDAMCIDDIDGEKDEKPIQKKETSS